MAEPRLIELIYIGEHFYDESEYRMSSVYSEDGVMYEWRTIKAALIDGHAVSIRQARQYELDQYEAMLSRMKRKMEANERQGYDAHRENT